MFRFVIKISCVLFIVSKYGPTFSALYGDEYGQYDHSGAGAADNDTNYSQGNEDDRESVQEDRISQILKNINAIKKMEEVPTQTVEEDTTMATSNYDYIHHFKTRMKTLSDKEVIEVKKVLQDMFKLPFRTSTHTRVGQRRAIADNYDYIITVDASVNSTEQTAAHYNTKQFHRSRHNVGKVTQRRRRKPKMIPEDYDDTGNFDSYLDLRTRNIPAQGQAGKYHNDEEIAEMEALEAVKNKPRKFQTLSDTYDDMSDVVGSADARAKNVPTQRRVTLKVKSENDEIANTPLDVDALAKNIPTQSETTSQMYNEDDALSYYKDVKQTNNDAVKPIKTNVDFDIRAKDVPTQPRRTSKLIFENYDDLDEEVRIIPTQSKIPFNIFENYNDVATMGDAYPDARVKPIDSKQITNYVYSGNKDKVDSYVATNIIPQPRRTSKIIIDNEVVRSSTEILLVPPKRTSPVTVPNYDEGGNLYDDLDRQTKSIPKSQSTEVNDEIVKNIATQPKRTKNIILHDYDEGEGLYGDILVNTKSSYKPERTSKVSLENIKEIKNKHDADFVKPINNMPTRSKTTNLENYDGDNMYGDISGQTKRSSKLQLFKTDTPAKVLKMVSKEKETRAPKKIIEAYDEGGNFYVDVQTKPETTSKILLESTGSRGIVTPSETKITSKILSESYDKGGSLYGDIDVHTKSNPKQAATVTSERYNIEPIKNNFDISISPRRTNKPVARNYNEAGNLYGGSETTHSPKSDNDINIKNASPTKENPKNVMYYDDMTTIVDIKDLISTKANENEIHLDNYQDTSHSSDKNTDVRTENLEERKFTKSESKNLMYYDDDKVAVADIRAKVSSLGLLTSKIISVNYEDVSTKPYTGLDISTEILDQQSQIPNINGNSLNLNGDVNINSEIEISSKETSLKPVRTSNNVTDDNYYQKPKRTSIIAVTYENEPNKYSPFQHTQKYFEDYSDIMKKSDIQAKDDTIQKNNVDDEADVNINNNNIYTKATRTTNIFRQFNADESGGEELIKKPSATVKPKKTLKLIFDDNNDIISLHPKRTSKVISENYLDEYDDATTRAKIDMLRLNENETNSGYKFAIRADNIPQQVKRTSQVIPNNFLMYIDDLTTVSNKDVREKQGKSKIILNDDNYFAWTAKKIPLHPRRTSKLISNKLSMNYYNQKTTSIDSSGFRLNSGSGRRKGMSDYEDEITSTDLAGGVKNSSLDFGANKETIENDLLWGKDKTTVVESDEKFNIVAKDSTPLLTRSSTKMFDKLMDDYDTTTSAEEVSLTISHKESKPVFENYEDLATHPELLAYVNLTDKDIANSTAGIIINKWMVRHKTSTTTDKELQDRSSAIPPLASELVLDRFLQYIKDKTGKTLPELAYTTEVVGVRESYRQDLADAVNLRDQDTTTGITTNSTPTTTTKSRKTTAENLDVPALLDIVADFVEEYDTNLTDWLNQTLWERRIPTCMTTIRTHSTIYYDYDIHSTRDGVTVAKCFVCGLDQWGIPRDAQCADAFAGDFIPLVPVDKTAHSKVSRYRKYCKYLNIYGTWKNRTESRSFYGRWTGGCSVRWIDLSGVYTQRSCRNRNRAAQGNHFASKRMAKLEMALQDTDNGCIISPMAVLTPLSRGISLFARFHACVCTGSWCNVAIRLGGPSASTLPMFLLSLRMFCYQIKPA